MYKHYYKESVKRMGIIRILYLREHKTFYLNGIFNYFYVSIKYLAGEFHQVLCFSQFTYLLPRLSHFYTSLKNCEI